MNISLSSSEIRLILKLLEKELQEYADGNYKIIIEDIIERLKTSLGE